MSPAKTILEDVLVLASGTVTTRPEDKSIVVRTVTLALMPDQVDIIAAAKPRGPLSLALRGLNDHQARPRKPAPVPPPPPPAPKPVVAPVKVPPSAPPPPPRFLAIYRGLAAPERFPMAANHVDDDQVVAGRAAARPR
jgi:pilus assembly protein CpaB